SLILGCTHYPLIAPLIQELMGPPVRLIDSGAEAARATAVLLAERGQLASGTPEHRFFLSDEPRNFTRIARAFLGRDLPPTTVEDRAPGWLRGKGRGWVTAEYGMLPRSTSERTPRTSQSGGRTQEIQRLIGRSLRAVTDLTGFGERTIILDCDVLEADGGTRTAAIDGALVALHDALVVLSNRGHLAKPPLRDAVAAISVGMVRGVPCLDLDYQEDSTAQVDMNVVM